MQSVPEFLPNVHILSLLLRILRVVTGLAYLLAAVEFEPEDTLVQ